MNCKELALLLMSSFTFDIGSAVMAGGEDGGATTEVADSEMGGWVVGFIELF